MVEYSTVNVKLTDTQLKKLKNAVKNKTGTTLRMSLKMFSGNHLPHELFLTTRQKTKLRNVFNSNLSRDLKFSKSQISKIIQSGGFLALWLCYIFSKYFSSGNLNWCPAKHYNNSDAP